MTYYGFTSRRDGDLGALRLAGGLGADGEAKLALDGLLASRGSDERDVERALGFLERLGVGFLELGLGGGDAVGQGQLEG